MEVGYSARFIKIYNSLEKELAEEVYEKINLFRDEKNHKILKVHKLHGKLKTEYSLSVNYKVRIIFERVGKNKAVLHAIGGHDVYKN